MNNDFNYDIFTGNQDGYKQGKYNQNNYNNNELPIISPNHENKLMKLITKILFLIIVIILIVLLMINFGVINLNKDTNFVIALNYNEVGVKLKKNHQLTATVYPEMIKHEKIIWTSSDENIVSVNENTGYLTANRLGETIVTASIGKDVKSECKVYVSNEDISV